MDIEQIPQNADPDASNPERRRGISIKADFDFDLHFWAILPALNINLHSNSLEFEWLCIGIYIESFISK